MKSGFRYPRRFAVSVLHVALITLAVILAILPQVALAQGFAFAPGLLTQASAALLGHLDGDSDRQKSSAQPVLSPQRDRQILGKCLLLAQQCSAQSFQCDLCF